MGKGALGALAAYWPEDTARYAHVPLKRVGDITLHAAAASAGDRAALVTVEGPVSYAELSAAVKKLAAALRGRLSKGSRVALALDDPRELLCALFACWETEMLAFATAGPIAPEAVSLFGADLVVGGEGEKAVSFASLAAEEGSDKTDRPDFKKPLLALAKPDRGGEVLHTHKTLAAMAIAMGSFFMMDGETALWLAQAPSDWLSLAMLLGAWQKGATVWAGWGRVAPGHPERVDYLVIGWEAAMREHVDSPPRIPRLRDRRRRRGRRRGTVQPVASPPALTPARHSRPHRPRPLRSGAADREPPDVVPRRRGRHSASQRGHSAAQSRRRHAAEHRLGCRGVGRARRQVRACAGGGYPRSG